MKDRLTEFLTDDLALATTLRCEGFEPIGMVLEGQQGQWKFRRIDGFDEAVRDYKQGRAAVEPREFMRTLRRTRRDLFDLLKRNGIRPTPNLSR